MNAVDFLNEKGALTEAALDKYIRTWTDTPDVLREAVRYSLFAGGKRLRPALVLGAADIVAGAQGSERAIPAACALEMIHTYSLIHDDLPAMDNDDLRRGRPTLHIVHGEAIAILAGDALLTMAFDILTEAGDLRVVREIAVAAGAPGMVGGQVIDLMSEGKRIGLDELRHLHACKTGALIRVAVRAGALLAGATDEQLDALTRYGEHIGLAFQIADDILDITGTEEQLGKPIGSDVANEKSTYPALLGLEKSRQLAADTVQAALDSLALFGPEADAFRSLARFIVERQH